MTFQQDCKHPVLSDKGSGLIQTDSGMLRCMDGPEQAEKASQVHLTKPFALKYMYVHMNTCMSVYIHISMCARVYDDMGISLTPSHLLQGQMVVSITQFKSLRLFRRMH